MIHIDIDPAEIGRNYPVEIGVIADLKQALRVLNRVARTMLPQPRRNEALRRGDRGVSRAVQESNAAAEAAISSRCDRSASSLTCAQSCRAMRFITTDVGWNKNGVGQQFPIYEPGSILTPGGLATMGFGAPAALGAKIARPDRVVVSLVGDGGFGQNPSVLATAVEQDTAVVWVVMNNLAYGTIAGLEKAHYGTTFGTVFRRRNEPYSPDFAAVAQAYGVDSCASNQPLSSSPRSNRPSRAASLSCSTSSWKMRRYLRRATGTSWTSIRRIRSERTSRREPATPSRDSVALPERDATEECHAEPDTKRRVYSHALAAVVLLG